MICKQCGTPNDEGTNFCISCGADLRGEAIPPMGNPGFSNFSTPVVNVTLEQRNIALCIILSFVTCGIYTLYWFLKLTEDTNKNSGDPNATSGGMAFLLCLVTCGIYTYYWMYKRGDYIDRYMSQCGQPGGSNGILYLILTVFGLGIVSYGLMQNELNKIATNRF